MVSAIWEDNGILADINCYLSFLLIN